MAISPRGNLMEIKETFWQKAVIEEQAISWLQKPPAIYEWPVALWQCISVKKNGNLNASDLGKIRQGEDLRQEPVLVLGCGMPIFHFCNEIAGPRFFPARDMWTNLN